MYHFQQVRLRTGKAKRLIILVLTTTANKAIYLYSFIRALTIATQYHVIRSVSVLWTWTGKQAT